MEPVNLLTGLLQQFSPTRLESNAVNYLVDCMQDLGYQAYIDEAGNAVGTIGNGSQEILLLGHIDTVPGEISVRQEGNELFGRGAVDAKGPLASFVCAGASAQKSSDWRITVIGAVGEEGDSRGAKYLCNNHPSPAMVVIGEPSGWDSITLGYKGSFWVDISFHQPASHTASGITSACDQAFMFLNQLRAEIATLNAEKERVFDQFSPSLRAMTSQADGFQEDAILQVNIRIPQNVDIMYMRNLLDSCASSVGMHPDFQIVDFMPAYLAVKNTPLVKAFIAAIRGNDGTPGFKLKTGSADMNLVGPAWNCPIIAYGAGDSNLDHTANEHIFIDEYHKGIHVLQAALERIQGL